MTASPVGWMRFRQTQKIHIDIDPSSINKNVVVDVPIVGDVAHVLEDMLRVWKSRRRARQKALADWWAEIEHGAAQMPCLSQR